MNSLTKAVDEIEAELGDLWIPRIYRERILRMRTRSYHLGLIGKTSAIEIQHTLLGIELKIGRRRMLCPDLATARYLSVFARAGCADVALPYDISRISPLADQLESSWQRMLLFVERVSQNRSGGYRARLRNLIVGDIRRDVESAGAGTAVPRFNQNTKQRRA